MSEVVVVPLGVPGSDRALSVTPKLEAKLSEAHVSVISLHDARDRFLVRSRPPRMPRDNDLEALARAAQEAIEHVAFGRTASAQETVRAAIALAERALESLNRETATARQVLDACLSLVRSSLQLGRRELAREQATRCRRLVPDLAPSRAAHPADVVGVLAEADELLVRMQTGHLTVQSLPKSGCAVFLNGRHLGTTPFELEHSATGEYKVQVECGRSPGRVHIVQLGDEPVNLLVDTEFDRAVTDEPRSLLRYQSSDIRSRAVAHGGQLGRAVGAGDVVLVASVAERLELLRVHVRSQRLLARATIPWTPDIAAAPAFEDAVSALLEGRIQEGHGLEAWLSPPADTEAGHSGEKTEANPGWRSPTDARSPGAGDDLRVREPTVRARDHGLVRRRRRQLGLGGTALVLGATAFVSAGLLAAKRQQDGEEFRQSLPATPSNTPAYFQLLGPWEDGRVAPYALGAVGAALTMAGSLAPLLTSPRGRLPRWTSILSGLLGLGVAAWGTVDVVRGGACDSSTPDRRFARARRNGATVVRSCCSPRLLC